MASMDDSSTYCRGNLRKMFAKTTARVVISHGVIHLRNTYSDLFLIYVLFHNIQIYEIVLVHVIFYVYKYVWHFNRGEDYFFTKRFLPL